MICPDCTIEVGDVKECPKCHLDLETFTTEGLAKMERAIDLINKQKAAKKAAEQRQESETMSKQKKGFFDSLISGGKKK